MQLPGGGRALHAGERALPVAGAGLDGGGGGACFKRGRRGGQQTIIEMAQGARHALID